MKTQEERREKLLFLKCSLFVSTPQNATYIANQKRFWELIDSWHKDCQQASALTSDNKAVIPIFFFFLA